MAKSRILATALAASAALVIGVLPAVAGGKYVFTTIDPPDMSKQKYQGTYEVHINNHGEIAGYYVVAGGAGATHGFLRKTDGTFETFAPSAVTYVAGLNDHETVVGHYVGTDSRSHGFLRTRHGTITTFDVPGAYDTLAGAINSQGTVTGTASAVGFARSADGAIVTFAPEGAVSTYPSAISDAGEITGSYNDTNEIAHGFKRSAYGMITVFEVPGYVRTIARGITSDGDIAGYCIDETIVPHGFVRHSDGTFTVFDPPNSEHTMVNSFEGRGKIAGSFSEAGHALGYLRTSGGKIVTIEFPGAFGSGFWQSGPQGSAVGTYHDSDDVSHGFLMSRMGGLGTHH